MNSERKTRVVLLFGGRSAEHEVSLLSARNVLEALDRTRFDPVLIGIDRQGRWHREPEATLAKATGDPRAVALDPAAPLVDPMVALASPDRAPTVAFSTLHGTYGEDGTMQGLLEQADVAYVGAGVLGSAVGMDKDVTKRLLRDAGIPIVDFHVIRAAEAASDPEACRRKGDELGYPLFCKPANAGSSAGVSRVKTPDALPAALRTALSLDGKAILERAVDAREVECSVLGNDDPKASVLAEIVVSHRDGFYSYDAKYVDPNGAHVEIPAQVPPETAARVQALAIEAFRVLELEGMARVDFFLDRKTGALYLNEVNTLPGFTAMSGYPKMWEATGIGREALVSRLLELGLERHARRRAFATSPP